MSRPITAQEDKTIRADTKKGPPIKRTASSALWITPSCVYTDSVYLSGMKHWHWIIVGLMILAMVAYAVVHWIGKQDMTELNVWWNKKVVDATMGEIFLPLFILAIFTRSSCNCKN